MRAGATGTSSGLDWNNAYPSLPSTLVRGATYYVADGNYPGYTFDDPGTSVITVKKATESDHGSGTGWLNSYGDGQAVFNGALLFANDYYVVDGQRRNESNWADSPSYGFRAPELASWPLNYPPGGDHITVRYMEVGGNYSESFASGMPSTGFYLVGYATPVTHITVSRCFIHNVILPFQLAGASFVTIEYCRIGPGWGKEAIRGQQIANNGVIRHNVFYNASQKNPEDPTSGCTAEIGIWDGSASGAFDNWEIYGNTIYNTISIHHSDAAIFVGGNGVDLVGVGANNCKVYNNTIVGIQSGQADVDLNGSNNRAFNNLHFACGPGVITSVDANATGNNLVATANPFVNMTAGDFRLAAGSQPIDRGAAQGTPYNVDPLGNTRGADGAWDVGAYEYVTAGPDTTSPVISGVASSSVTSNSFRIAFQTSEPSRGGVEFGLSTAYGGSMTNTALVTTHAFQIGGLAPNTLYHFRAAASDAAGNASQSQDFSVQTLAVDGSPPAVSLTTPNPGAILSGAVTLTAGASDNIGVAGVSFVLDGNTVGAEDSSAPFSLVWNTLSVANGPHTLAARARDAAGNVTTSSVVSVEVANVGPDLRNGLVGYWPLEEGVGGGTMDMSLNGNTATLANGTAWGAGRLRGGVILDGVDDYMKVENSPTLALTAQFTLSAWVKLESAGGWQSLVSKVYQDGANTNPFDNYSMFVEAGVAGFRARVAGTSSGGSRSYAYGSSLLNYGTWYHLTGTYDGAVLRLYVNGVEEATASLSGPLMNSGQPLYIGCNGGRGDRVKGVLDDVRVYQRALSASEVQALQAVRNPSLVGGVVLQQN